MKNFRWFFAALALVIVLYLVEGYSNPLIVILGISLIPAIVGWLGSDFVLCGLIYIPAGALIGYFVIVPKNIGLVAGMIFGFVMTIVVCKGGGAKKQ